MDGRTEGRKECRKEGRKIGRKEEGKSRKYGWTSRGFLPPPPTAPLPRKEGRKEGRTDRRKEGRTDGREEGRVEGRKEGEIHLAEVGARFEDLETR
jgi:hypothetical protein